MFIISIYIVLSPPSPLPPPLVHPPLTAVQISTTDTNTQTCVLIFFFFLFIFRLDFISVSFRNDVLFNLVLCFGVSIPSLVDMSILYFG